MKKIVFVLVLIYLGTSVFAKKKSYQHLASNLISAELKENANVVVRFSEEKFVISDAKNSVYTKRYAYTILREAGKSMANIVVSYDKKRSINNLSILILDANGKQIKKVKSSEIEDYSSVSSFSIYEDDRVKAYRPVVNSYPFTIVCEYEVVNRNTAFYPDWDPQRNREMAIESASFEVVTKPDITFRYKESVTMGACVVQEDSNRKSFKWELHNIYAFKHETFAPYSMDLYPTVQIKKDLMNMDNYKGKVDNWTNFGLWSYELNKGRQILPIETQTKLKELVKDCKTDVEKAKILYKYLQENTRYVSVQVGIGGWQTFSAEYVDENKFGDCKALSNYMMSMLSLFDIESYYTLVQAGTSHYRRLDPSLPGNYFNHAILTIPFEKDTVFLECTSNDNPFGYLGDFTEGRYALMVKPSGGELVKIPAYTFDKNLKSTKIDVTIDGKGNAEFTYSSNYNAMEYDDVSGMLKLESKDQEEELLEAFNWGNVKFKNFSYSQEAIRIPLISEELEFSVEKYASVTGNRMFIPVNKISPNKFIPKKVDNRRFDIRKTSKYTHIDSVKFKIPASYKVEHLPKEKSIETEFGEYTFELKNLEGEVLYIRKLIQKDGIFPKEKYDELIKFYKEIAKGDKKKIVLVKDAS